MSSEIKIETIKLNVAGKELELTVEQAKSLKDVLEELFPTPRPTPFSVPSVDPITIIREVERRRDIWPSPYPWKLPDIVCKTGDKAMLCITSNGPAL